METKTGAVRAFLNHHALVVKDHRCAALVPGAAKMADAALRGAGPGGPYSLFDSLGRAVAASIGRPVIKVAVNAPGETFDTIRYSVEYADSLGFLLEVRHWPRLEPSLATAYGAGLEAFKNAAWRMIAREMRPQLSFWDDPFSPPKYATTGKSLSMAIFYFIAYAAVGDGEGMESLANLIRWLPYAVPIGERPAGSGEWLIALRPALK